jgi:hypothetical protein
MQNLLVSRIANNHETELAGICGKKHGSIVHRRRRVKSSVASISFISPKTAPLLDEEGMLGHAAQRGWLEVAREPDFNGFQPPRQQPLAAVCPSLFKEGSRFHRTRCLNAA